MLRGHPYPKDRFAYDDEQRQLANAGLILQAPGSLCAFERIHISSGREPRFRRFYRAGRTPEPR